MTHILVAYATKYGATREIAEKIAEALRKAGCSVEAQPAEKVTSLEPYGAVVLGSAVYAGSWRKEAADFLRVHEAGLAARPVWLFSSGPTGKGDPVALMKGWRFPEALQPLADGIKPRAIALFHGAMDLARMQFADRLIIKAMKAPTGDFRDWAAIEAWALAIARKLAPVAA
jgi:menaquinone-dependent protoporphyrinogen oxidase